MGGLDEHVQVKRLSSGAAAGAMTKVLLLPFDVSKKRLQVQGFEAVGKHLGVDYRYTGLFNCVATMVRDEGYLSLFKGAKPSVAKASMSSAIAFFSYECICDILVHYLLWKENIV